MIAQVNLNKNYRLNYPSSISSNLFDMLLLMDDNIYWALLDLKL